MLDDAPPALVLTFNIPGPGTYTIRDLPSDVEAVQIIVPDPGDLIPPAPQDPAPDLVQIISADTPDNAAAIPLAPEDTPEPEPEPAPQVYRNLKEKQRARDAAA